MHPDCPMTRKNRPRGALKSPALFVVASVAAWVRPKQYDPLMGLGDYELRPMGASTPTSSGARSRAPADLRELHAETYRALGRPVPTGRAPCAVSFVRSRPTCGCGGPPPRSIHRLRVALALRRRKACAALGYSDEGRVRLHARREKQAFAACPNSFPPRCSMRAGSGSGSAHRLVPEQLSRRVLEHGPVFGRCREPASQMSA
jgi:hypothetical protein